MKRFSAREFMLLCVPVVAIAGAGWWASWRGPLPAPDDGKPKLKFSVKQPTTLQAFDGVEAVVVASMTPDTTRSPRRPDYCLGVALNSDVWIDVSTPQAFKTWNRNNNVSKIGFSPRAFDEWFSCNYYLALRPVPEGEVSLRFKDAYLRRGAERNRAKSIPVQGQWTLDKSLIKPIDFSRPRVPEVELRSVAVVNVDTSHISVTALFVLTGKEAGINTIFEEQATMSSAWYVLTNESRFDDTPKERALIFTIWANLKRKGKMPKFTVVTGRVSAGNNWPLAFKTEPFEFRKVKIGQQLQFKSWPAPLPPGAKS